MKTIFNTLFITAAAVFAFSCEKPANDNITPSEENLVELTLTVGADTKTQLGGENKTSIIWQENDKLIVFDGTANREFEIKDFEPGKNSAVFTGLALPAEKYYVVHSTAEGSEPVFTVPETGDPYVTGILVANVQKAVKGSYDPAAFASVGIAEVKEGETDLSVQMRNTCSLVKVSLESSDIKTIEISTTDENKYLTANCKYIIKEYPGIAAQSDRYLSAVLDSESAMEPGDYYIAILPRELNNLKVTYTKEDGSTASVTATGTFNFDRSSIVSLGIDDSDLEFPNDNEPEEPVAPEELVLTVDFTVGRDKVFTGYIPNSNTPDQDFTFIQDGVEYPFNISSSANFKYTDSSLMLNVGGSSNGSVSLPAVEGMKISTVYIECAQVSNNTPIYVYSQKAMDGIKLEGVNIAAEGAKKTLDLSDNTGDTTPQANTEYYFAVKAKGFKLKKLVITYISAE